MAIDPRHPAFYVDAGLDINGKRITSFSPRMYKSFQAFSQANGFTNQNEAMQSWQAQGTPSMSNPKSKPKALDPNGLTAAFINTFIPNGQAPGGRRNYPDATEENIKLTAKKYRTNPGEIVRLLEAQGKTVPESVKANLRKEQFTIG